jgi:LysM domain
MSLNEHLTRPENHETLPFRADCPICRASRLAGSAPGGRTAPRGTAVLMVAALSAGSSFAAPPAVALAQDPPGDVVAPDEVQSGGGELGVPDPEAQPQLPGSDDSTEAPPGGDPGLDEGAPIPEPVPEGEGQEASPIVEPDAPQAVPEDPEPPAAPAPPAVPAPPAAPAPPAPPAVPAPPAPVAPPPAPAPPVAEPAPAPAPPATAPAEPKPAPAPPDPPRGEAKEERAVAPVPPAPAPAAPLPAAPQPVASTPEPSVQVVADAPEPTGDVYVVQSGDTLWTIAQRRLGAGAGPGEVARFVDRLWTLNASELGTGSPDLIMPGQRLRMPAAP